MKTETKKIKLTDEIALCLGNRYEGLMVLSEFFFEGILSEQKLYAFSVYSHGAKFITEEVVFKRKYIEFYLFGQKVGWCRFDYKRK